MDIPRIGYPHIIDRDTSKNHHPDDSEIPAEAAVFQRREVYRRGRVGSDL
jgi:hypothetical protein